jgi:hypothetical protein
VNLIAAYDNFCTVSLMARTVLRYGIDAIMSMRRKPGSRWRRSDLQKAACPGKRGGKTGIFRRPHLISTE